MRAKYGEYILDLTSLGVLEFNDNELDISSIITKDIEHLLFDVKAKQTKDISILWYGFSCNMYGYEVDNSFNKPIKSKINITTLANNTIQYVIYYGSIFYDDNNEHNVIVYLSLRKNNNGQYVMYCSVDDFEL